MKITTILFTLLSLISLVAEEKKADVHLVVTGNDTMRFDKTTLEVTSGQTVKLVFKNTGTLPKAAMGHNLVILKPSTDIAKFATAAMSASKNDYIPQDKINKALIVAHSKILGPGEEHAILFTAGQPGAYPYICSFPGHYGIMKGIITVK